MGDPPATCALASALEMPQKAAATTTRPSFFETLFMLISPLRCANPPSFHTNCRRRANNRKNRLGQAFEPDAPAQSRGNRPWPVRLESLTYRKRKRPCATLPAPHSGLGGHWG